ncbi:MAG: TIGR04255 family protein [Nitrospira sp.]|nr:TIGR04255 family protein [Nitrospira sp.]
MTKAAKPRHLSRAPITEALIDIRVTLPKETRTLEHLAALNAQFGELYQDKKDIKEFQYRVQFDRPELDEKTSTHLGFRYTNAESTQVIQTTISGFTFSRLPPYEDWERLKEEAKRTWAIYSGHVRPETITRVAVRYINRLVLPGPLVELDQYLRYVAKVPKVLPQVLGGYFSRIVVPDRQGQRTAIITQSSAPNPAEVSPILDIDVFMERPFSNEDEVWGAIDRLRDFKNKIFFDCITEKAAKLFT